MRRSAGATCQYAARAIGAALPGCAIVSPGKSSFRAGRRQRTLLSCRRSIGRTATLQRHAHHHHRFDIAPAGPGAEMETSRGCPYHCTFCAKENFRDRYRRRPLTTILAELDGLSRPASDTFILSTRFSCRGANYSKRLLGVQLCLACRPASICGATTCSICWVRRVAYRSRRGSKVSPRRAVIGSTRIAASRPTN